MRVEGNRSHVPAHTQQLNSRKGNVLYVLITAHKSTYTYIHSVLKAVNRFSCNKKE